MCWLGGNTPLGCGSPIFLQFVCGALIWTMIGHQQGNIFKILDVGPLLMMIIVDFPDGLDMVDIPTHFHVVDILDCLYLMELFD